MNFYTLAHKLRKECLRTIDHACEGGMDPLEAQDMAKKLMYQEFDQTCKLGILLMERFKEMMPKRSTGTYMITIRPDETKIKFPIFKTLVEKYVRKKMIEWTYSFEQKGEDRHTLGKGFHVHIIGTIRARDKGTCLSQTCNFFADCTASNCIQIDYCSHPEATIRRYLVDYISDDGHKATTKLPDAIWRRIRNLQRLYSNNPSSPVGLLESIKDSEDIEDNKLYEGWQEEQTRDVSPPCEAEYEMAQLLRDGEP